jgi:hypothetical protein
MILTNHTDNCFVFAVGYVLLPGEGETLEIDNDVYSNDFRVRYNVNRIVENGTGDISISGQPVDYPEDEGDPKPETRPRLKPMFQAK